MIGQTNKVMDWRTEIMGDKVSLSGDFSGAIINFKSTLTNVQQSVQSLPNADNAEKAKLERLISELSIALDGLPAEKSEIAEAMAHQAQCLVDEAKKENSNSTILGTSANGLKQVAKTVADVAPTVLKVAVQIADLFSKFSS